MIAILTTVAGLLVAVWAGVNASLASAKLMTDAQLFQTAKHMPPGMVREAARRVAARMAVGSAVRAAGWTLLIFCAGWTAAAITWGLA